MSELEFNSLQITNVLNPISRRPQLYMVPIKSNLSNFILIIHSSNLADLCTADLFLFNIKKSKNKFNQINYDALEKMKYGEAFTAKCDSQQLKIRVPNVVFSNSSPDVKELEKVRFRVFNINNNQLEKKNIVVDPKEKKESVGSDSGVDSDDL